MTGGIGGMADACGTLLGATQMLGSISGPGRQDEQGMPKLGNSIKLAADFYNWFKEKRGSTSCRDIVTEFGNGKFYDFGDPKQAKEAFEKGVTQKCDQMAADNAARAAEMLWDELHREK